MKLTATALSSLARFWRTPRKPPEPEPCSDYEAELDDRIGASRRSADRAGGASPLSRCASQPKALIPDAGDGL